MCRVLELRGWTLARINGSHHIYRDHATGRRTVVPVHANRDLRRLARTLTPAKPAWRPPPGSFSRWFGGLSARGDPLSC
ncbi:MAG TPA: type II toxin-antitoxin system HicA family toxin [Gemmataceae bacterium]|nr:type II toxin-antitoxin system HicA family toxin [Gemmataceae bacterium]